MRKILRRAFDAMERIAPRGHVRLVARGRRGRVAVAETQEARVVLVSGTPRGVLVDSHGEVAAVVGRTWCLVRHHEHRWEAAGEPDRGFVRALRCLPDGAWVESHDARLRDVARRLGHRTSFGRARTAELVIGAIRRELRPMVARDRVAVHAALRGGTLPEGRLHDVRACVEAILAAADDPATDHDPLVFRPEDGSEPLVPAGLLEGPDERRLRLLAACMVADHGGGEDPSGMDPERALDAGISHVLRALDDAQGHEYWIAQRRDPTRGWAVRVLTFPDHGVTLALAWPSPREGREHIATVDVARGGYPWREIWRNGGAIRPHALAAVSANLEGALAGAGRTGAHTGFAWHRGSEAWIGARADPSVWRVQWLRGTAIPWTRVPRSPRELVLAALAAGRAVAEGGGR